MKQYLSSSSFLANRLVGAQLRVGNNSDGTSNPACNTVTQNQVTAGQAIELTCNMEGRYLMIQQSKTDFMNICEVKAYTGACQGK